MNHVCVHENVLITGDLNAYFYCITHILEGFGLFQHVTVPTHISGHTLDVVITYRNLYLFNNLKVVDQGVSDHFEIVL